MIECLEKDYAINLLEYNAKVYHYRDRDKENIVRDTIERLCLVLREAPAADVQPVRRGCWELTGNPSFRKCSECGAWWSSDITDNCFTKYCPKCGARMDGDTNG